MNPYLKLVITFISIGLTILYGYTTKNKKKRIIGVMLILLVISVVINRSIYWIIYWAGPYHGRVMDADTDQPIEGASVAGIWAFEYNLIIAWEDGFGNAKETTTDSNGKFKLGPIIAFSFWPFSRIERMQLVVFKPGYDSHPPAIRRKMKYPGEPKVHTTDNKYYVGDFVHCKAWRECEVRLNKAINIKEEISAYTECKSRLSAMNVNQHKVSNFIEVIKKPKFKYLEKKN
jgi:hypothetical protein